MNSEHEIVLKVYEAKNDIMKADSLIRSYIPFIRKEASKFLSKICTEQDDEFSIAMIAFHEAINSYTKIRGAFLPFASKAIRNRLIDYHRKEQRHKGNISIYEENENNESLSETIRDERDHIEESTSLRATQSEIAELSADIAAYGVNLIDVTDNAPKQERTLNACKKAIRYAIDNPVILDELIRTKKLPMNQLVNGSGIERKTLERHRRYILVMLVIQTNGYEILRDHLRHTFKKGGN